MKKYLPCIIFTLIPIVLIILIYLSYSTPIIIPLVMFSFGFFIGFIIYLWIKRKKEIVSTVAIVPTIFGPMIANLYLKWHLPCIYYKLEDYGSDLVHLSFFFAGLIGLVLYLLYGFIQKERSNLRTAIHFLILVVIFSLTMTGEKFVNYEILPGLGFLPSVTLLLFARGLLVLNAVVAATWPPEEESRKSVSEV